MNEEASNLYTYDRCHLICHFFEPESRHPLDLLRSVEDIARRTDLRGARHDNIRYINIVRGEIRLTYLTEYPNWIPAYQQHDDVVNAKWRRLQQARPVTLLAARHGATPAQFYPFMARYTDYVVATYRAAMTDDPWNGFAATWQWFSAWRWMQNNANDLAAVMRDYTNGMEIPKELTDPVEQAIHLGGDQSDMAHLLLNLACWGHEPAPRYM